MEWLNIFMELLNILATVGVGVYIARVIQKRITNKRTYKDYLIDEIREINNSFDEFIEKLISGNINPKFLASWFKTMSFNIEDMITILEKEFNNTNAIDLKKLREYHSSLRDITVDSKGHKDAYQKKQHYVQISDELKESILQIQGKNKCTFRTLIKLVNNY